MNDHSSQHFNHTWVILIMQPAVRWISDITCTLHVLLECNITVCYNIQ